MDQIDVGRKSIGREVVGAGLVASILPFIIVGKGAWWLSNRVVRFTLRFMYGISFISVFAYIILLLINPSWHMLGMLLATLGVFVALSMLNALIHGIIAHRAEQIHRIGK